MFIQGIRGKAKDADGLREAFKGWENDVGPGAKGYLGSTAGVADDGTFAAVVRFDSEEAARANSDRPEQGSWWDKTSKLLDDARFYDCPEVNVFMGGGSDDAGFVQLMIYKPTDMNTFRELSKQFEDMSPERPDIIGGTSAIASDGTVIDTNYFTSESEAREGERKEMPAEMQSVMQRFMEIAGSVEYIDLRDPWLHSA